MIYHTLQYVIPRPICQLMSNGNLLNGHLGPADFQKGLMIYTLNGMQPACPNKTKADFSFRPLTDVMCDDWTSKEPQLDVCRAPDVHLMIVLKW